MTVLHLLFINKWIHTFMSCTCYHTDSVGFLPGRKVFLPHEGEKQGRKYFCLSFCHFCREKWQKSSKPDKIVLINLNIDINTCTVYDVANNTHYIVCVLYATF